MNSAYEIAQKYITFFTKRGHVEIANSPLVLQNDPTTLFTSSGMQPLLPYLLGEQHPAGNRLVNAQNCFRAQDIDEIGDNRHTTFFRMLGNWSLGDYFKKEQIPYFFKFLTSKEEGLGLNPQKLYVTVFSGFEKIPQDDESIEIWKQLFDTVGIKAEVGERIFLYGVDKNWWSRAGTPEKMPPGEPGGPDSEVFYDFGTEHDTKYGEKCHVNCDCGRFVEIGNSVFMQYIKKSDGSFGELPQRNVDFGGGLERLLAAVEHKSDVFETSLFSPIIQTIETLTQKNYRENSKQLRIITDHFTAAVMIAADGVVPSNKEQGYLLRRLIRRGLDNLHILNGNEVTPLIETIVEQYKQTDKHLVEKFESIKYILLAEQSAYMKVVQGARSFVNKKYKHLGDELKGVVEISPEDAFQLYTSYGLSPTQIKSLGYTFDDQAFAEKMKEHQNLSRAGASHKFAGGLADHSTKTIMGHTATHLLHQALRDVLGDQVHQSGSNITVERIRFDFNFDRKLTDNELKKVEEIVNEKIKENLPVQYEFMPLEQARKLNAIGLFDEKYADTVKIYSIGKARGTKRPYSVEFCGGPHVESTGKLKKFILTKEEGLGKGFRRIYAIVE